MVNPIGLVVWLTLLVACAICLKWATEITDQKKEKVLACIGLITGLIAFWMLIIAALADTPSIPGYIFWLTVAVAGTWYLVCTFYRVMSITGTAQPEGR
jgi:hypothetical protein